MRSRHLSVVIRRPPSEVYDLASDPARLPDWAAGLAVGSVGVDDDELVVDSPEGRIRVRFVPSNSLGVLDHEVTLPDGTTTLNPLRVVAHPSGAEVVFTIRQFGDDDAFDRDCEMVTADLGRLTRLLEGATPGQVASSATTAAEIRIAGPYDAATVALLLYDFNTEFDCPAPEPAVGAPRLEKLLARDDVLVVLARRGTAGGDIGFALLTLRPTPYWDGPLAHLEDLYVRPAHRSRGVGTAMLQRAVEEVRARGSRELHVNVDGDDTGARRFYERHGFSHTDPDTGSDMYFYLRQM